MQIRLWSSFHFYLCQEVFPDTPHLSQGQGSFLWCSFDFSQSTCPSVLKSCACQTFPLGFQLLKAQDLPASISVSSASRLMPCTSRFIVSPEWIRHKWRHQQSRWGSGAQSKPSGVSLCVGLKVFRLQLESSWKSSQEILFSSHSCFREDL